MRKRAGLILLCLTGSVAVSWGQLSGSNVAEYAWGNIPGEEPSGVHSIYDQFNLQYKWKGLGASVRIENYYSNDDDRDDYTEFSQYALFYRKKGWDIRAGHFIETLGKGLLYRGFEVKNSIFENQIYRVKHAFYRDMLGAKAGYTGNRFSVKGIYGKSLINELPPTVDDRRLDLVRAGEASVKILQQNLGAIYLHNENDTEKSEYLSFYLGGTVFENIDYHGEYAHRINDESSYFNLEDGDSYGGYLSLSYSASGFGLSFEAKDYHNLFIGSGISDPPTLVKEHSYKLLNRSTHVPYLFDESGIQIEAYLSPWDDHLITLNHSRSKNELGEDLDFKSAEYFAEWQYTTSKDNQVKVFVDYSFDEVLSEDDRYAAGLYYTHQLENRWSLAFESEFQHLERTYAETNSYQNVYVGLVLSQSTKFSTALIWEFTNDDKFADLSGTEELEEVQHYPGINFSYRPNRKNTIQLFAGKRRGGPACTAGICYEVLDFKGIELRWTIKI